MNPLKWNLLDPIEKQPPLHRGHKTHFIADDLEQTVPQDIVGLGVAHANDSELNAAEREQLVNPADHRSIAPHY